jgi:hypothetical protein
MTNKIKGFWNQMGFWNKFRSILTASIALVEGSLLLGHIEPKWQILIVGGGIIVILITHIIEDRNNNGRPDIFE